MTAIIGLPLLLLFIHYANSIFFLGFVCVLTSLALWEYLEMSLPEGRTLEKALAVLAGTGLVALVGAGQPVLFQGALTAALLFFAVLFLLRYRDLTTVSQQLGLVLFGFLYLPLLLGHMSLLRGLAHGQKWIFLVLFAVMACDTMAYFVGTSFGRRRLYPAISPKKSIEGALGGLVGSLCGVLLAKFLFFPALAISDCLVLGLLLGLFGQVGDLFESMLKRSFGVKDSGTLIPGHGGLLDRLDSLLFSFAPVYYFALWRMVG
ncbi:phosphatidate cytidylyltransferase [Desulfuromonas sp.]|uniref:phosphatidate cytidylyltransferase n=1 Tax=Desulfuromonas sp. TaxID=892 RepID=UPI0025BCD9F8|nr:phosphatidate cytidylyltransferase [Desulfuromonas sp.]